MPLPFARLVLPRRRGQGLAPQWGHVVSLPFGLAPILDLVFTQWFLYTTSRWAGHILRETIRGGRGGGDGAARRCQGRQSPGRPAHTPLLFVASLALAKGAHLKEPRSVESHIRARGD
ncbi:hypothetical protein chiPu_0024426 [Chiloscyllium punctatum]|uniref:Uncharacterized protein n=1 Tax=Chiloscyllium punctatum TaxID=137246 RepID=A0A401TC02_CHIPU|nr:hypothetical protein [Chiloscyllium punctatum]